MLKVIRRYRAKGFARFHEAEMSSLFSRRLMAWLVALAVIAGASPVMAASCAAGAPTTVSGFHHKAPTAPLQAAVDESLAPAIEDDSARRIADLGVGDDVAVFVLAAPAVLQFGWQRSAAAETSARHAADVVHSRHKTGPPTV
jgi:hypothetical protein